MSSAEQHMSPAPSSLNGAHQTVPDESSLIATAVEDILDNFKSDLEANIEDLEANIEDHEVIMYYEYVFDSARELIWSAVRDEVTMTLKDEVANRKREGRTGGSIDDVTVYPQSVRLDEDLSIHFKDLSVYGEAEQQMSPAPSSLNDAHQTVPDESSLIATAVEDILDDFKFDLEANIRDDDVILDYDYVFDSARELIWSAVRDEITMTLKDEVASRKREGRTGGSMDDVSAYPTKVGVDEDMRIHLNGFTVYGKGWTGEQTWTNLVIRTGLKPLVDSQKKE
ncbi:hypothetical protein B9479_002484 [Cryptococcus floricola]|uniref:Uncharacterized protein n=1 Tax=Cryptococcus floricola TaxID=2591691 RepID=A0A5D3B417_9TREE|nr:hypothetical protein B9479_002484 [Cryptococcus floricola]